jgi:FlaA1/EpsC-like NDP-sugar epimerase
MNTRTSQKTIYHSDLWRTLFLILDMVLIFMASRWAYSLVFNGNIPTHFLIQSHFQTLWILALTLVLLTFSFQYSRKVPFLSPQTVKLILVLQTANLVLSYFFLNWFYRGWWDEAIFGLFGLFVSRSALGLIASYSKKMIAKVLLYGIPVIFAAIVAIFWNFIYSDSILNPPQNLVISKSVLLLSFFISTSFLLLNRSFESWLWHKKSGLSRPQKAILIGSNRTSMRLLRMNEHENKFVIEAIFSQETPIHGLRIYNHEVHFLNWAALLKLVQLHKISKIILAEKLEALHKKELQSLVSTHKIQVLELNENTELLTGKKDLLLDEVSIEDILNREEFKFNPQISEHFLHQKVILVTGAGGSIGSELCRQIAMSEPKLLILLGKGENSIFNIFSELKRNYPQLKMLCKIASVAHFETLEAIFSEFKPQIIFHAAAHKHVTLMEQNPAEAHLNNVIGTQNVAQLSAQYLAEKFVLISTDKAVNPSCIMGHSKALAEKSVVEIQKNNPHTDFRIVRFGNVLGSRGSVIPIFLEQIKRGGPVTVTHPDVMRFFMSIPEAVSLVLSAATLQSDADVFVLEMGEQVKIIHLAEQLIRQAGFEPYTDISIEFTGLQAGEKIAEELWTDDNRIMKTENSRIYGLKI